MYYGPLSNFAFNCNMRRYNQGEVVVTKDMGDGGPQREIIRLHKGAALQLHPKFFTADPALGFNA